MLLHHTIQEPIRFQYANSLHAESAFSDKDKPVTIYLCNSNLNNFLFNEFKKKKKVVFKANFL